MKTKEKPIITNHAAANERYQKAMKEAQKKVQNPYDSDKHKQAQEYLKDNDLEIKPLSPPRDMK